MHSVDSTEKRRKPALLDSVLSGTTAEPSTALEPEAAEFSGTHSFVNCSYDFSTSHRSVAGSHASLASERRAKHDFSASQRSLMGTQRLDFGESRRSSLNSQKSDLGSSQRQLGSSQTLQMPQRLRKQKLTMSSPLLDDSAGDNDDGGGSFVGQGMPMRPRTHAGVSRPTLSLSQSLGSLKMSLSQPLHLTSTTPRDNLNDFKQLTGGVSIIFFDFDGTLTATPGDRAARRYKQKELCERAPMLEPRLRALRAAGVNLGIISKSTEGTIRDSLAAAGLEKLFDAPVLGKAVGFEGKVGFIDDMARDGALRILNTRSVGPEQRLQAAAHRVLLVDDDVRELERARERGLQVYAAPPDGGLQDRDFEVILAAVRLPPARAARPATTNVRPRGRWDQALFPMKPAGKWRNLIIFSGECFDG